MRLARLIAKTTCHCLTIAIALTWATNAQATAFMEIVWTDTTNTNPLALASLGTNAIVASPGDLVTAELRITTDALGLSNVFLSVAFDEDFNDELDFIGAAAVSNIVDPNCVFPMICSSLALIVNPVLEDESSLTGRGVVTLWHFTTGPVFGEGLFANQTIVLGIIGFQVTANVVADGPDVRLGKILMFDELTDSFGDPLSEEIPGSVNLLIIPEPNTALLLGIGLTGLGWRGRVRRS